MRAGILFGASWAAVGFSFFKKLGPLGLFILGICDSSFLFLPFGNDLLLLAMVTASGGGWWWVLYTLVAAAGSVVGVFFLDAVIRKAGEKGLEHFVKPKTIEKFKRKIQKNAGRAVFVATIMPPPFPFTAVVMVASALQSPRRTILLAVFFGRLLRFTIESLLALRYGQRVFEYLDSDVLEYAVYAFLAFAVVGSVLSVRKWTRGRQQWSHVDASNTTGKDLTTEITEHMEA